MGFGLGINTVMAGVMETQYGTPPGAGYSKLSVISENLGEEQPLIEDDQLGTGREGVDPTYDVITANSDVTVPMNTRGIGFWLRQTFGVPVTTALTGAQAGLYQHVFTSGVAALPSCALEVGNPDVPTFSMNYGNVVNTMKIGLAKSGLLNAVFSLIGQGEVDPSPSSAAGALTPLLGARFAQATGSVSIDGQASGIVTGANLGWTNNLDPRDVIRADGRIGGVNPGTGRGSGDIMVLLDPSSVLLKGKARSKIPVSLGFGWVNGVSTLNFALSRVFLPKPKFAISGPKGIATTFNWQSSGASGPQLVATLINDVASYAA